MQTIVSWLTQQSTHSGIVLLALLVLAARAAGIDLALVAEDFAKDVATVAAMFGVVSALAKVALPDAPKLPPAHPAVEKLAEVVSQIAEARAPAAAAGLRLGQQSAERDQKG